MPLMTRAAGVLSLAALVVLVSASPQFTSTELRSRPDEERALLEGEIVGAEPVGEGVTKPLRLTLRADGREIRGIWKSVAAPSGGGVDEWRFEVAAYRMDKLLGLGMVPPTVERSLGGKPGSLQFWVTTACSLLDVVERGLVVPEDAQRRIEDAKYVVRAFDSLIANDDRTQQNILYTADWRTILIDHSRAFRSDPPAAASLYFGRRGTKKGADGRALLIRRLPKAFAERLSALSESGVRQAVGPYLTETEVRAIMSRRGLLVREIEEIVRESGGSGFLYDR